MSHSVQSRPVLHRRVLLAGIVSFLVLAVTLAPRQFVAPARTAFMNLAHRFLAPIVEPMTYLQLESTLNAFLFVPYGAVLAVLLGTRFWGLAALLVFVTSFTIEQLQAHIPGRVPDLQDILWNTIGGVVGSIVMATVRRIYRSTRFRRPVSARGERVGRPGR
jgi:glycopeptide antibiotics resistance protein